MGAYKLIILALGALFLLSVFASAEIEMRRSHTFYIGEEKVYTFLNEDYSVRVMQSISAGGGRADIRINNRKMTVFHDTPAVFGPLTVSLVSAQQYNASLNMVWSEETETPDFQGYLAENRKEDLEINGKIFRSALLFIDTYKKLATFIINDEEFTISAGERYTLKDGSILKANSFITDTLRSADVSIWASDTEIDAPDDVIYDLVERVSNNEKSVLDVIGISVEVAISAISQEGVASLTVDGEEFELEEGGSAQTVSGIDFMVNQFSMKYPQSLQININVPEGQDKTVASVDMILGENQKSVFDLEDYTIDVKVSTINESGLFCEVNGKKLNLDIGKEAQVGDVNVYVRGLNPSTHPPKAMLTFSVPIEPVAPKEPVEPEEEPVACTMDVMECPDGSFVGRVAPDCAFKACPGPAQPEEPEEEVVEEVEETPEEPEEPEEKPPAYTGEPIFVKNLKAIGGFFTGFVSWLF